MILLRYYSVAKYYYGTINYFNNTAYTEVATSGRNVWRVLGVY